MSEEDKKLQKHLVDEMMQVYETNPNVMLYMQSLMENYQKLEQENKHLNLQLDQALKDYEELLIKINKAIEYIKIVIEIIKEQPSSCELNDIWTLEHLNSFLEILGDKENE